MSTSLNILFVLLTVCGYAQNKTPDSVKKLNGDSLSVYVKNISEYDITYSYPNETVTYTVSRNVIEEIRFATGRTEKINKAVIVKDEDDWEKVRITSVPSDIKGLKFIGTVRANKTITFSFKIGEALEALDNQIQRKLKYEAAALGAHIILRESKITFVNGSSLMTGKAYGY